MIEKLTETKETAFITFTDYSKAFDNVSHNQLFNIIIQMGFPTHLVYLIQNLYVKQEARIPWNYWHTEPLTIGKDVRQGCILSPNLFSIYKEMVMCEAEVRHLRVSIGGRLLSNLCYTDDTGLCANNYHEADELINQVNGAGARRLLKLNVKKQLLVTNDKDLPLWVRGEPIERVTNIRYLGSITFCTFSCDKDIAAQSGMAKK